MKETVWRKNFMTQTNRGFGKKTLTVIQFPKQSHKGNDATHIFILFIDNFSIYSIIPSCNSNESSY